MKEKTLEIKILETWVGLLISLPWVQSLAVSFLMSAHPYLWNRVKAHFSSTLKFWNWRDKICKYFWASFLRSLGSKLWVLQSHVFCCNCCMCAWRAHLRSNIQNLPNISSLRDGVGVNVSPDQTKAFFGPPPHLPTSETYPLLSPVLGVHYAYWYSEIFKVFPSNIHIL